ncbi:MAG: exodeoxyribonuclease VII large subunit, partial [Eubacteriales bacterium]|nr:exodeoxyribonuclease VII large subunit [Eubacteriales bacterium]
MNTLSVSELNEYVRKTLAVDPILHNITITGEVSNFKQHPSGHWYFSLKDDKARIACVMFRQYNMMARTVPKDGMKLNLKGSVGLYTASGTYQFYAEQLEKCGTGQLYEAYIQLKNKLTAEGLFDPAKKIPLPMLPKTIGVATSSTGAVLHDIFTVVNRRFPGTTVLLRPCKVQGEGAAEDLTAAVIELSKTKSVEVIIIGRGGGSLEDLWAFNDEKLVRTISACKVPIISAVGHETDITLCDFAADMRAATPSQAAEFAVPDKETLKQQLETYALSLYKACQNTVDKKKSLMQNAASLLAQHSPQHVIMLFKENLNNATDKLNLMSKSVLDKKLSHLQELKIRLNS